MTATTLRGPFLTRREAARRAGVAEDQVTRRPDLLRLGGRRLEEVYFAFQFDECGVRPDLGLVVQRLKRSCDDLDISHWLVEPQDGLNLRSPLDWLAGAGSAAAVLRCSEESGPQRRSVERSPMPDRAQADLQRPWRRSRRSLVRRPASVAGA